MKSATRISLYTATLFAGGISLLALLALLLTPAAFADATDKALQETQAYFSFSVPTVASTATSLSTRDTNLAQAYVNNQLALYGITKAQFLALSTEQQREVLSIPGRQTPLSRQALKGIVPFKSNLPANIEASLQPGALVSFAVLNQFGVKLPGSVDLTLSAVPSGYQRIVLGSHYLLLDATGRILDKQAF